LRLTGQRQRRKDDRRPAHAPAAIASAMATNFSA
jgi:hypothetical protein